ncbi:MAG TPA: DUF1203 domain-containing protein [Usitatibacter sp.]|nr:DUF1203 domain-containing protein [Usitatibacter sp.]
MSFRVRGLSPEPFRKYFAMSNEELRAMGAVRVVADGDTYPCRVSLGHARRGDELVLLNYEHQPGHSPYRSNHAIYVARGSGEAFDDLDVIPEALRIRLLSVRAFDKDHMIVDADITDGKDAAALFERLLANPDADYLHVHNAKRGCYAAKVVRA